MTTSDPVRRPTSRAATSRVLTAYEEDDFHAAVRRMQDALAQAWAHGYSSGFRDGVADATLDKPDPKIANPYHSPRRVRSNS